MSFALPESTGSNVWFLLCRMRNTSYEMDENQALFHLQNDIRKQKNKKNRILNEQTETYNIWAQKFQVFVK